MLRLVKAEKARRSLYEFVRQAWSVVEPAQPFIDNWHIRAICEHLEAVTRGEIHYLLINVPPGHAKSLLVCVFWPAWVWINRPAWRGLFGSYSSDLSLRDSVKCRALIESPWYRLRFSDPVGEGQTLIGSPSWELSGDQNVKSYFTNTTTGARLALSVGGKATGFRGNTIVVDDPLNAQDAMSKLKRDEAIFWWDKVMSSRLNDLAHDSRVIIMQRLHEDDLSGHVLDQPGDVRYEHLCLPSEFETARRARTYVEKKEHVPGCPGRGAPRVYDSVHPVTGEVETLTVYGDCPCKTRKELFWIDPRTQEGELLFPELFPKKVLDEMKVPLGSAGYAGQHQQRPAPEDGERFKRSWWRFWKPDGLAPNEQCPRPRKCYEGPARALPTIHQTVISLDCSFKDTDGTDYVVFQVWGTNKADRFLLDQVRGRLSFTATIQQFRLLCAKYPTAYKKLVEDKANGSAVIDTLTREIPGIVAVNPEGGKEARAAAIQPQVESGNVFLPEGAPWLEAFIDELASFPLGKNDDQVDAMSQALLDLAGSVGMTRAIAMSKS